MNKGSVSYYSPSNTIFVSNDSMVSVKIIIIKDNTFWVTIMGGKSTNIVSRGKKMASGRKS